MAFPFDNRRLTEDKPLRDIFNLRVENFDVFANKWPHRGSRGWKAAARHVTTSFPTTVHPQHVAALQTSG